MKENNGVFNSELKREYEYKEKLLVHAAYFNNIIIHNYEKETFMKVIVNFRTGRKIEITTVFKDLETAFEFIRRTPACNGIRYKVINHNGEM